MDDNTHDMDHATFNTHESIASAVDHAMYIDHNIDGDDFDTAVTFLDETPIGEGNSYKVYKCKLLLQHSETALGILLCIKTAFNPDYIKTGMTIKDVWDDAIEEPHLSVQYEDGRQIDLSWDDFDSHDRGYDYENIAMRKFTQNRVHGSEYVIPFYIRISSISSLIMPQCNGSIMDFSNTRRELDLERPLPPRIINQELRETLPHIINQVLLALEYIHGQKIGHGDLKCADVLYVYDHDGRIHCYLSDFGASREIGNDGFNSELRFNGDEQFSPPELITHTMCRPEIYDTFNIVAADYWAFALLLLDLFEADIVTRAFKNTFPAYRKHHYLDDPNDERFGKFFDKLRGYMQNIVDTTVLDQFIWRQFNSMLAFNTPIQSRSDIANNIRNLNYIQY